MAENQTAQQPVHDVTDENANALSTRIARKADTLKYYLLGGVVVLAAVIGGVLYAGNAKAKALAAASDEVFRSFVGLQGKPPAEAAPALVAAAKAYAGQPAGIQAAVHAFGTSMDAGNYADAESVGGDFLKNYPDSPLVPRFKVAVAQAQLLQGKTQAAIDGLRLFAGTAGPETLPEAKLALAQALEQYAEEGKADAEEYKRRLQAAEVEYTDITSRARLGSPLQTGYWPQAVVQTADYALVQIKDVLAGHELAEPAVPAATPEAAAAVTPAELETVRNLRPPGAAAAVEAETEEPEEEPAEETEAEPEAEEEAFGPAARLEERAQE